MESRDIHVDAREVIWSYTSVPLQPLMADPVDHIPTPQPTLLTGVILLPLPVALADADSPDLVILTKSGEVETICEICRPYRLDWEGQARGNSCDMQTLVGVITLIRQVWNLIRRVALEGLVVSLLKCLYS